MSLKNLLLPVALSMAMLFAGITTKAQVELYTFAQTSGTYTPISGGTVAATATSTSSLDNAIYNVPSGTIPFTFLFNGTGYTGLNISTNGFITFGATAPSSSNYTPISNSATYEGAISAFAGDLNTMYNVGTPPVTGEIRYEIVGTAPNREFVVQWSNFRPSYTTSTTNAYAFDFQIRLQENGNKIVIVYGGALDYLVGSATYSSTRQIGLRGVSNTDYNNRTNSTSTAFTSSSAGTSNSATQAFNTTATPPGMPTSGLTYTWTPPSCIKPSGVSSSAVTTTGATLGWTASSSAPASGYEYEVRTSGAAGSGATGLVASGSTAAGITTATVSGLSAATTYTVYVRSNCGGGDYSTWTAAYTFTTPCNAFSVPYNENFDAVTTPALPSCSVVENVNGDGSTWKTGTSSPSSAPNNLAYVYNTSNAANDWWFTPGLNLTSGTVYQIVFKYRGSGTTYPEKLEVKVGNGQNAAAMTGTALWSDANITNNTYQTVTINYTAATTGVHYFGWHAFSAPNMNYLYVDDISIDVAPSCLSASGVTASAITSSGATLGWTASSSAPASGYEYEVRTSGAAGSGATGLAASGSTAAGITTAAVSGLSAATTYTVYVRANCGGGDYSTWTEAYTFTTLCAPYMAPFTEGFNSGALPTCWTNSNSISSTSVYLLWKFSGAPDYGTTANGRPAGSYAWVDASSPYNAVVTLTTPVIDLSALTSPYFKFDWFKNNTDPGTTHTNNNLMVEGYDGTAWVTLFNDTSNSAAWRTVAFTLPASFNGLTNAQFRFSVDKSLSNYFYDDLLLDSFSITNTPACLIPSDVTASAITASGATLSWTASSSAPASGYEYEVRTSGAAGSGATGLAASGSTAAGITTAAVSGLSAATTYTVYVRSNCGSGGFSNWTAAYTFTTPCGIYPAPFVEGFNSGALPTCWTNSNSISSTTANLRWKFSGAPDYGASGNGRPAGTYAWVDASSPYNAVVMLTTPVIDLSALTSPYFKFDWFKNNTDPGTTHTNNNLMVEGYDGTAWVTLFNDTSNSAAWRTVAFTLPASFNGLTNAQFRFSVDKSLSSNFYDDLLLDSFSITSTPLCFAPTGVTTTSATTTGATLSWTASSSAPASGYEYEVRTSGAAGSGATGLAASGSTAAGITTATVSGLSAATTYTVYVRGNCGTDGYSDWSATYTFTTPCNAFSVPYNENFDAVTTPALPSCSVVENVNGDGSTWKTGTSSPSSAPNNLAYTYHSTNAANDWWFTPGLNLTSGTVYQIVFKYRGSGTTYPEKLEVKVGNGQNAAAMTGTALWSDANITNNTYQTVTINYTAATTGVHYFGWHAFSAPDMNYLYVDDISIVGIPVCSGTPNPGATLATSTTICYGDQIKLYPSNHAIDLGLTYQWYASADGGISFDAIAGATSDTLIVSPTTNTTYRLEVTCSASSLANTSTPVAITFNSNITSVTGDTICGPGTATLMAAGATGDSIRWYDAETGGTLLATTTGSFTSPVISATTTYFAQAVNGATEFVGPVYTGTNDNGTNVGSHGIVISTTVPNVQITSADIPFTGTGNITVQLQTSSGTPVQTYVATGLTGAGTTPVTVPLDITVPTPGSYRLLVTAVSGTVDDLGYGSASYPYTSASGALTVTSGYWYGVDMSSNMYLFHLGIGAQCASPRVAVTANVQTPIMVDLGPDVSNCTGDAITLDAGNPGATYLWSTGATTQTISASTSGTYSVTVANGACTATDEVEVSINTTPVVDLGPDVSNCTGDAVTLDAGNPGAAYLWSTGETTQTISVSTSGTYSVEVANGACSATGEINVSIDVTPVVSLGTDTMICSGELLTLDAGNPGAAYLWSTGATTQTIDAAAAGTYSVTVSSGACSASDTLVIDEIAAPVAGPIVIVDNMPSYDFSAPATTGGLTYSWDFGDGTTATTETASHTYTANGTYTVTFTVTNACGQSGSTTASVTVSGVGVGSVAGQPSSVQVYPNPSSGLTVVEAQGAVISSVEVMDNLGRMVLRSQPDAAKTVLDVKGMAQGIYTLRIQTNKGISTVKLVVKD